MAGARGVWWDDVVSVESVPLNDHVHLLWGDRVRVTSRSGGRARVEARGSRGEVPEEALGGEPLLEVYVIDVGQGDGLLVVTPEGHNIVIDGGLRRTLQQTGKSAADFIDWKFHRDYLPAGGSGGPDDRIALDLLVATHADRDHYGGLEDLLVERDPEDRDQLGTAATTVERFLHPGLSPQGDGSRDLGPQQAGAFVSLLDDRASAEDAVADQPVGDLRLRGEWARLVGRVVGTTTAAGAPTPIQRVSDATGLLPGFAAGDLTIEVLAPVEVDAGGRVGLEDLGDFGENKNGHSVALRVTYRDRTFLLAGDLNDRAQAAIRRHEGDRFEARWGVDVAKACHHGSHHVDFDFLRGVGALATIFSSGDANTFDHPRPWVLGGAALAGRVVRDGEVLRAPLVYSTEVARSIQLADLEQLRRYDEPQRWTRASTAAAETVSGDVSISRWRVVTDADDTSASSMQPVQHARVMERMVYGLVNVRTDGHRLLFAIRNEGNATWSTEVIEPEDIARAERWGPVAGGP